MTNKPITQEAASKDIDNAIALRRVLVPTDVKPDGRKALEYAVAFASRREAFDGNPGSIFGNIGRASLLDVRKIKP